MKIIYVYNQWYDISCATLYINLYQNTAECINEVYKVTLTLGLCPALQVLDAKLQVNSLCFCF